MDSYKVGYFSTLNQKFNSGEIKPFKFKKLTIEMLSEALKEINRKTKRNKSNYVVINSQINDELYTWDIIKNNKK